jgi:hypothetical protein
MAADLYSWPPAAADLVIAQTLLVLILGKLMQEMLQSTARGGASTNPMMSYITDAAPQKGEATMRAGLHAEVWYACLASSRLHEHGQHSSAPGQLLPARQACVRKQALRS